MSVPTQRDRPLAGIKVLDFSRMFAGPLCTMMLSDLGAEVIKIEPPAGDDARRFGPPFLADDGMNFVALNRGKQSVVLDLKIEADLNQVRELTRSADIVVENFRPGVTERLGIDYESLRRIRPDLVYCSITGYGRTGSYRDQSALDLVIQGLAGLMERQGRGKQPQMLVVTIADTYAASLATQGILAALRVRDRDGEGQLVEVNLLQSALYAQAYRIISKADKIELPAMNDVVPYGPFEAADRWFNVAVATERSWKAFCEAVTPSLAEDPRFLTNPDRVANQEVLLAQLSEMFAAAPATYWLEILERAGVPCGPIQSVEDVVTDQHVRETEGVVEIDHPSGRLITIGVPYTLSATPLSVGGPAPSLGEHTQTVHADMACQNRRSGND
jgi:crotonobetainyl-CoA:carnitine CoA-transferase CaiB-like acyl-CoA transferase